MAILWLLCFGLSARAYNLEFFVTGDTHFRFDNEINTENNLGQIWSMNNLPGKGFPDPYDPNGIVGTPHGVLIAGDLTTFARAEELSEYMEHYPVDGGTSPNVLHFPVKEIAGNHDYRNACAPGPYSDPICNKGPLDRTVVHTAIAARQGGINHSWDWNGVYVAALDLYPSYENSLWLYLNLMENEVTPQTPVVIMTHYGYDDWHADNNWWNPNGPEGFFFAKIIQDYNVVALIHGHTHRSEHYVWNPASDYEDYGTYDVYSPGAPANGKYGFVSLDGNIFSWFEVGWKTTWGNEALRLLHTKTIPEPSCILLLGLGVTMMKMRRLRGRLSASDPCK